MTPSNLGPYEEAVRNAFPHASRLLLVVAVFFASGSHWAVLQTMAWSTMLVEFSRTGSVVEAVAKTFDGKHPCQLCSQVKKGLVGEEEQDGPATPLVKIELFHETARAIVLTRPDGVVFPAIELTAERRAVSPTEPPPRRA